MGKYSPITKDDEWFAGEDKVLRFRLENETEGPVDASSWNFEWKLRVAAREPETLLIKTTPSGSGIAIIAPAAGDPYYYAEVAVEAADTDDMETGEWFHTLKRTDVGGQAVLAYGEAVLQQAATR